METYQRNLSNECEEKFNETIALFWGVERNYTTMSALCGGDVNLNGFHSCFNFCAIRTRRYCEKLCKYLVVRGGRLNMLSITPITQVPKNLEHGVIPLMEITLQMEEAMVQKLRELYFVAKGKEDIETCAFIQSWPLRYLLRGVKWATYHLNGMKNCNNDHVYNRLCMEPLIDVWIKRVYAETSRPFDKALLLSRGGIQNVWSCKTNYRPLFVQESKSFYPDTFTTEDIFVDMFNI
jgi:ferritin